MEKLEFVARNYPERSKEILTDGAIAFLSDLVREFGDRHAKLLLRRREDHEFIRTGKLKLGFRNDRESELIRSGNWTIPALPSSYWESGIEITGPASNRKMMINALTSGARRQFADSEDSESPTWMNIINGQVNLFDAVRETMSYAAPGGKEYSLKTASRLAELRYRPRGLHLPEPRILFKGKPIAASLCDFGLFFYHNAREILRRRKQPHVVLAKLETAEEARWWNDVFSYVEDRFKIRGTLKATLLVENIRAVFELEEIIFALREHVAEINNARWDELASLVRLCPATLFPERSELTMLAPFMQAYEDYNGYVAYRRGVVWNGGMEAQIPIKDNPALSSELLSKGIHGKQREADKGCRSAWVAHPDMVGPLQNIFTERPADWREKARERFRAVEPATAEALLSVPGGKITFQGLYENAAAKLIYLTNWLCGRGAVGIDYRAPDGKLYAKLMDDHSTVEISRNLDWSWASRGATLADGKVITNDLIYMILDLTRRDYAKELAGVSEETVKIAEKICRELQKADKIHYPEYFTEIGMPYLCELEGTPYDL